MDQEQPSGELPEGFSSSIRHRSVVGAPEVHLVNHFIFEGDMLWWSYIDGSIALNERYRTSNGRRAVDGLPDGKVVHERDLGESDMFSQILTTPGWTPPRVVVSLDTEVTCDCP